jgi:hypothetical protein
MDDVDASLARSADAIWGIAGWLLLTLALTGPAAFFNPGRYTLMAFVMSISMGLVLGGMSRQIRRGNGTLCLVAGWLGVATSVAAVAAMAVLWFWGDSVSRQLSRGGFWVLLLLVLPATVQLALKSFVGYRVWRDRPSRAGGFEVIPPHGLQGPGV